MSHLECGSVVWARLGQSWWPGTVTMLARCPKDYVQSLRKIPIAVVKFFNENEFQDIHKTEHIQPYNCEKKEEMIRKGQSIYKNQNHGGVSLLAKFEADIITAEKLTGGDMEIFRTMEEEAGKRRIDYSDLGFGSPKVKKQKVNSRGSDIGEVHEYKKLSIGRLGQGRVIQHRVRIMEQPKKENAEQDMKAGSSWFKCYTCGYTCTRVNVIVWHNKGHIKKVLDYDSGIRIPGRKRRKPGLTKPNKPSKRKSKDKSKDAVIHAQTNGEVSPLTKKDSEEAQKLLMDWNEEEDEGDKGATAHDDQDTNGRDLSDGNSSDEDDYPPPQFRLERKPAPKQSELNSAFDALLADTPGSAGLSSYPNSSYLNNDSDSEGSGWEKYYAKSDIDSDEEREQENEIKEVCEAESNLQSENNLQKSEDNSHEEKLEQKRDAYNEDELNIEQENKCDKENGVYSEQKNKNDKEDGLGLEQDNKNDNEDGVYLEQDNKNDKGDGLQADQEIKSDKEDGLHSEQESKSDKDGLYLEEESKSDKEEGLYVEEESKSGKEEALYLEQESKSDKEEGLYSEQDSKSDIDVEDGDPIVVKGREDFIDVTGYGTESSYPIDFKVKPTDATDSNSKSLEAAKDSLETQGDASLEEKEDCISSNPKSSCSLSPASPARPDYEGTSVTAGFSMQKEEAPKSIIDFHTSSEHEHKDTSETDEIVMQKEETPKNVRDIHSPVNIKYDSKTEEMDEYGPGATTSYDYSVSRWRDDYPISEQNKYKDSVSEMRDDTFSSSKCDSRTERRLQGYSSPVSHDYRERVEMRVTDSPSLVSSKYKERLEVRDDNSSPIPSEYKERSKMTCDYLPSAPSPENKESVEAREDDLSRSPSPQCKKEIKDDDYRTTCSEILGYKEKSDKREKGFLSPDGRKEREREDEYHSFNISSKYEGKLGRRDDYYSPGMKYDDRGEKRHDYYETEYGMKGDERDDSYPSSASGSKYKEKFERREDYYSSSTATIYDEKIVGRGHERYSSAIGASKYEESLERCDDYPSNPDTPEYDQKVERREGYYSPEYEGKTERGKEYYSSSDYEERTERSDDYFSITESSAKYEGKLERRGDYYSSASPKYEDKAGRSKDYYSHPSVSKYEEKSERGEDYYSSPSSSKYEEKLDRRGDYYSAAPKYEISKKRDYYSSSSTKYEGKEERRLSYYSSPRYEEMEERGNVYTASKFGDTSDDDIHEDDSPKYVKAGKEIEEYQTSSSSNTSKPDEKEKPTVVEVCTTKPHEPGESIGEVMTSSAGTTGSGTTYMLVAVDDQGNTVPTPAPAQGSGNLMAVEATMEDGSTRTLYIDPSQLGPNVDLNNLNLMLHIDTSGQEHVIIPSSADSSGRHQAPVIHIRNQPHGKPQP
ncbi:uncharacterized protein LOC143025012 [Oratosquilla oratoria]|uniref:uncharacterized protein LOC143025012 n=1 Tax=Oratosquilla oratoria TaxID=337810 RepID=UPI003F776F42